MRYIILFIFLSFSIYSFSQEEYRLNCLQLNSKVVGNSIELSWSQNSSPTFQSYNIYYQVSSPYLVRNFVKVATISNQQTTNYVANNLALGSSHYFYLSVTDTLLGEYCNTNNSNAYLPTAGEVKGPEDLISISGSFGYYFEWKSLDSINSSGYYIYVDTLPNPSIIFDSTNSFTDTSIFTTALDSEKVYFVRVAAKDSALRSSGYSTEITDFYTPNSFQGPQNLSVEFNQGLKVSWDPVSDSFPNFYRYLIYRGTNKLSLQAKYYTNQIRNKNDTSIFLPATTSGVKYFYQVKAVNYADFQSNFSNYDSLVYVDTFPPNTPVLLSAQAADEEAFLTWTKDPNLSNDFLNYEVYGDTISPPTILNTNVFGSTDTSEVISGLTNNQTYFFRLRAKDVNGNFSGFSNILNVTPVDTTGPGKVSNLNAPIDSGKVTISWIPTPNLDNDFSHYNIYKRDDFSSYLVFDTLQNINASTYIDLNITNNKRYFYKVVPVDVIGNEGVDNEEIKIIPTRVETELNDAFFTADVLDSAKAGILSGNTDDDFFSFTISQPSQVTIQTDSIYFLDDNVGSNITDTYIDLIDTNGITILASNNNDPSNGNYSRVVYNLPYGGKFFAHVNNNNNGTSGYYSVQISKFEPDAYEPNNATIQATALADTQAITKLSIYPLGDIDFFKFSSEINARAQVSIYNPFYNGVIKFYDDQNQTLASTIGNTASFIIPDTTYFFFSYEVPSFTTPLYNLDFKIIPPISYSDSFKITEIKFSDSLEFIEIYNFHYSNIKAKGFSLLELGYQFPDDFHFAPFNYTVIANDSTRFYNKFGFYPNLDWGGNSYLSNTGQTVNFLDSLTSIIDYVTYNNGSNGFPQITDSSQSIELLELGLNNNLGSSWKTTDIPFGTPTHKVSFPRNYVADLFEPNNTFSNSKNIQFLDSLLVSLSELDDTADFFLIKPRIGDTLDFKTFFIDSGISANIQVQNTSKVTVFQSNLIFGSSAKFIANSTDTFIVKLSLNNDLKQFIINEGRLNFELISSEKILFSPWYEGFENLEAQDLPNGYRAFDLDGNGQTWGTTVINVGQNGTKALELSQNVNGNNDWLLLPPVYVRQDDFFSFFAKPSSVAFPEKIEFYVSNRISVEPSDFTQFLDSITIDSSDFKEYRLDLSNFTNQVIRLGIRGVSINQNIVYLDNFKFSPPIFDATVKGLVKDAQSQIPISGVEVSNGNNLVYSDSVGYFEINELPYGNISVVFNKVGYSKATYTFSLNQGDTISFNPVLAPTTLDTFYYNPFDDGLAQGFSQVVSGSKNWSRGDSIIYGGQLITASQGDTMLFHGGNLGYNPSSVALYTFKSGLGFDFTKYKTIDLSYDLNFDIDTSDGVYLLGNGSFIINLDGDSLVDSADVYSGNSGGWQNESLDISYLNNFNDIDLNFLFISNPFYTNGFGFAVDNIRLVGEKEIEKPIPQNLIAESYLEDTIKLHWVADTSLASSFRIFRKAPNQQFVDIGSTVDTFFVDTNVVKDRVYNYYVIASYLFGESERSNNVVAQSGIPTTLQAPYSVNFNSLFSDTLPAKWGYDLSINNPWLVGDSATANTFNANFRGTSRFVYGNFFSFNVFGDYYESLLAAPWFDFQNVQNELILSFDYSGDQSFENHILVYKDGLGSSWKTLDTLQGNFRWKKYRYNLSSIGKGNPFFQLGFLYQDDSTKTSTPNVGFAIDNFNLSDIKNGFFYGNLTSETGSPISNANIEIKLTNSEDWNFQNQYAVITDSLGHYKTPVNSIYDNFNYTITTGYFGHDSLIVENQKLLGNDSLLLNLQLELDLPFPEIIGLVNDSLGFPIISWNNPKNIGELSYDNGSFLRFDSLASGGFGGLYFETGAPHEVTINQIAFFSDSVFQPNSFDIIGFGANLSGSPILSDTVFKQTINLSQGLTYGWNFISLNQTIDTNKLSIVIAPNSGTNGTIKIGLSDAPSTTNSFWKANSISNLFSTTEGIMIRAFINVGNSNYAYSNTNYQGTINVFRLKSTDNAPIKLDSALIGASFTDTSLNIGDTAFYYLTGNTAYGESEISNIVGFVMEGLPYYKSYVGNLDLDFLFTTNSLANTFSVQNIGLDTLTFNTRLNFGLTQFHQIDTPNIWLPSLENSNLYCFSQLTLVDTISLNFSLENLNQNNENIEGLELFFPNGLRVISSTNLNVFNSPRFLLSGGQTGDSITLAFSDPNTNGKGEVGPFEGGSFTVDVVLDSSALSPVVIPYSILGDNKRIKSDSLQIGFAPFLVSLNGEDDTLAPQSFGAVGAAFQLQNPPAQGGRYPAYFQTQTNDQINDGSIIPFYINIDPARGVFRGLVTDDVNNDPLPNIVVTGAGKTDTTDAQGWFYFTDIPVGEYEFSAFNEFYDEGSSSGKLFGQNDTSTLLITLSPRIPEPENLTARGESNAIRLNWNLKDYQLFYDMEQPQGTQTFEISDWKTVDGDGDGFSWDYYSAAPFEGLFSIANTANSNQQNSDWLISKQIRIEEANATFSFHASPQDFNFSEERFVVRASTTGDDILDFTDSLYSFKFPTNGNQWQNFNVNLGSYLGDSIFVAVECVSNGQFKLKLDALTFNSARYINAPIDSGKYSFKIFRSKNNSPNFIKLDSISFANDTISYLDTTALLDTLYTYYITSLIPQINQNSNQSNFASFRLLSKDAGVVSLLSPVTGRNLTSAEDVEIEIENLGTDSIYDTDTIDVFYQVNGAAINAESFLPDTNYGPGEIIPYTFTNQTNLSNKSSYDFKIWTKLKRDNNAFNDTLNSTIIHKPDTLLPPPWNINPSAFQFNMAMTAEVFIIDTLSMDSADILAAFSGNQVRGLANIQFVPAFGKWVAQITVYSNLAIENINFKVWDASRDSIFDILESYTFINNQIYGSLTTPEKLHTLSGSDFYDVGISNLNSPDPLENTFNNSEDIVIQLQNYGSLDFNAGDSIKVDYKVERKGFTLLSGTKAAILTSDFISGDTLNFDLNETLNMSDTGVYTFSFNTKWFNDVDNTNDTLIQLVYHNPVSVPIWTVDPSQYQYSAFITARVLFDDILSVDEDDMVAAIISNQVRGVSNVQFVSAFSEYVIQMPIYSNALTGEIVKFRAFDYSNNETLWVEEEYKFANNAIWGSLVNPERLHAVTGYNGVEINNSNQNIILFPNPTNGRFLVISKDFEIERLEIFSFEGKKVLEEFPNAKYQEVILDDFANGLYQVKIYTSKGLVNQTLLLTGQ